ncbi:unnamed protein product [Agarophyton chilense]
MDVAQKMAYDPETDDESMVRCLAFAVVFRMVSKRVLTMRMDYYQLSVSSGAAFAAQMAKTVEALMLEVESSEYSVPTLEYQKVLAHKVVKATAQGETARSVRSQG